MNFSNILFIVFLIIPLSTSLAQTEDLIFEDQSIDIEEEAPPPPSHACKTCDDYWVISDFNEGIRAVKNRNGQIGFINDRESLIVPLEYEAYNSIHENRIIVSKDYYKKGIIDFRNKVIVPFEYSSIYKNSDNAYKVTKNSRKGILDRDGNEIIPTEYESISFKNGYYIVNRNGNSGILDVNGNTLLNPIYKSISRFVHNYFICQAPGNSNIIDIITGQKLLKGKYDKLSSSYNKLLLANKNNQMGLINFSEEVLIPFDYDAVTTFDNNLYKVSKKELFGIYDLFQETEIISTEYEDIRQIKGGYRLKKEGKYGFAYSVKNKLKTVIPIEYDEIYNMDNGMLRLTKNKKHGIYNIFTKKMIIPISYDKIESPYYSNNRFYLAYTGQQISILSGYDFTPIIDKQFDNVKYKDGFLVCLHNGQYYLYGAMGYVYQEQLDDLVILNSTFIKVKKGGKWGIYSAILKDFIIPCEHDKLYFDSTRNMFKIGNDNYKMIGKKLIKQ